MTSKATTIEEVLEQKLGYQRSNDGSWWTNDWMDNQTDAVNEATATIQQLVLERVVGEKITEEFYGSWTRRKDGSFIPLSDEIIIRNKIVDVQTEALKQLTGGKE